MTSTAGHHKTSGAMIGRILRLTALTLIVVAVYFAANVDLWRPHDADAQLPGVSGEGTPKYIAKWVSPSGNQDPIAEAGISREGVSYFAQITVTQGVPVGIWLSADKDVTSDGLYSRDPDGWTHATFGVSSGGKCDWNSDLNQGAPTFETTVNSPASATACNISLGTKTFNDAPGTYPYQVLRITDRMGAFSPTASISVRVKANSPPTVHAGAPHSITVSSAHTHSGASASDPDNNLASYAWSWVVGGCPGNCPTLSGSVSGALTPTGGSVPGPTFTPASAGIYRLRLTVVDSLGLSSSDTVTETAPSAVRAPTADAGPSHELSIGPSHTHSGASASDLDGDLNNYAWSWISCPEASCPALSQSSGTISGSAASISGPQYTPSQIGSYVLRLTVTDNAGNTDSDTVTDYVPSGGGGTGCREGCGGNGDGTNYPPTANAGPDHSFGAGAGHTHSGASASDPDGNLVVYQWSWASCSGICPTLSGNVSGAIVGGAVSSPTIMSSSAGVHTLRLAVEDAGGLSATDDAVETITVSLPQCSDGIDNDDPEDTIADYPADPGCENASDDDETDPLPQCSDGIDNDDPEDTIADFPADPGCIDAADDDETDLPPSPQCSDGVDNDGDGKIDYGADPGCTSPTDDNETDPTDPVFEEVPPE